MADLFDMKVGGLGFHLTAHMIALIALFVACFAITGYISFRDKTIDGSALKSGTVSKTALNEDADEDIPLIVLDIPLKEMVADGARTLDFTITQPANSFIEKMQSIVTEPFTETNAVSTVGVSTGPNATGTIISTAANFGTAGTQNKLGEHNTHFYIDTTTWTPVERTVHVGIVRAANIVADSGNIKLFFKIFSAV